MSFVDLELVTRFRVPQAVVVDTYSALREGGRRDHEVRVLWVGRPSTVDEFAITRVIVPAQRCSAIDTIVEQDEIQRIFAALYANREVLAIQIHTHPGAAFHSRTDDEQPITTQRGALSIVVPDYALAPAGDLTHCALYRLGARGWAGPLGVAAVRQLLAIEAP